MGREKWDTRSNIIVIMFKKVDQIAKLAIEKIEELTRSKNSRKTRISGVNLEMHPFFSL